MARHSLNFELPLENGNVSFDLDTLGHLHASEAAMAKQEAHLADIGAVFAAAQADAAGTLFRGLATDDFIIGSVGDDTIQAAGGDDTLMGGSGNDRLDGGIGDDSISGGSGNDNLTGADGHDYLYGGSGNDRLDGGAGPDYLAGGSGDDQYLVTDLNDQIAEVANDGTDTLFASLSYTLAAGLSIEVLATSSQAGTSPINLTGNELAQVIRGNDGDNVLNSGGGADTIYGFGGDDSLIGGTGAGILSGDAGNDTLVGGSGSNTLSGGAGDDTLIGGTGSNTLYGGIGNDTYVVSHTGQVISELTGGGVDTITSSVNYRLPEGVAVEYMVRVYDPNTARGQIILAGNDLDQVLSGYGELEGGGGNDTLIGGHNSNSGGLIGGPGQDVIDLTSEASARSDLVFSAGDSTGPTRDIVLGFHFGGSGTHDRLRAFPYPQVVDPEITHGALSAASFDADLSAAVSSAQLAAHHAVFFIPDSGDLAAASRGFLIVDVNGQPGYQAEQDTVVQFNEYSGTLTVADFY